MAIVHIGDIGQQLVDNGGTFYGSCATGSLTGAKVVECSIFRESELVEGVMLYVLFANANEASNITLNVNGIGAKAVVQTDVSDWWTTGEVVRFVYDGTNWIMENKQATLTNNEIENLLT